MQLTRLSSQLVKKLKSVNESLKKFAHVNKKAVEQYKNFTEQRKDLIERQESLDQSAESIEELVEVLDQRKDEAIERTFKQVASNFEEVFEKLVPAGRGRLIIQRRIDQVGCACSHHRTGLIQVPCRRKVSMMRQTKRKPHQWITTRECPSRYLPFTFASYKLV